MNGCACARKPGGHQFCGTDFELFGARQTSMDAAQAMMNDFRLIRVEPDDRRFRPADVRLNYLMSLDWLVQRLQAPFDGLPSS